MNVFRRIAKQPIRVAIVLSVLVHLAALWKLPPFHIPLEPQAVPTGPLIVQLAPPPSPPMRRERPQPQVLPRAPAAPPRIAERPRPAPPPPPPVIARRDPAPEALPVPRAAPPAVPVPVPAPAPAGPPARDLASYIEARRQARGEVETAPVQAPPTPSVAGEDPNTRANRIAAANLGLDRKPTYGPERRSGGVFEPTYISSEYAEFTFYGWNRDIRRDTAQKIEVRRGQNPDIRIAMVRRMIRIIREHEQEDFVWESQRLGRYVTLSARQRDNAGLEEFLIREFFEDPRRPAAFR